MRKNSRYKSLSSSCVLFAFLVPALLFYSGCNKNKKTKGRYQLQFEGRDDRGFPLAGVGIEVGGTKVGTTDDSGALQVSVNAIEGEEFPVLVQCPIGYQAHPGSDGIFFRKTLSLEGKEIRHIRRKLECEREQRLVALVVHGEHSGLKISIDGKEAGETGEDGYAHLQLRRSPNTNYLLEIDSSAQEELVPGVDKRLMQIAEKDSLHIIATEFSLRPKKKRKIRRRKKKAVETEKVSRPVRIH